MLDDRIGARASRTLPLNAQQTNLVRSVLQGGSHSINTAGRVDPETGVKTVPPLALEEVSRFRAAWSTEPVGCIRSMNHAIASVREPSRSVRYLLAAFDLELLMDRADEPPRSTELVGIPSYLKDGYTDLGFTFSKHKRERILVDKERLSQQLVSCKRQAIEELGESDDSAELLQTHLRELGVELRESVDYAESDLKPRRLDETVFLSDCVDRKSVACRHLSILMQLRLQECGIRSQLAKGVLRLYGLKGRHAWNVVRHGDSVGLVDVTFAEDDGPLVLVGTSLEELYQRAADLNRVYCPSPDTSNHYQIRRSGGRA